MEEVKRTFAGWLKSTQKKLGQPPVENKTKKKILLAGFEGKTATFAKEVIGQEMPDEDIEIETMSYTQTKTKLFEKIKGKSFDLVLIGYIPHKIQGATGIEDLLVNENVITCVDGNKNLSTSKSAVRRAVKKFLKKPPE